jgi:hypothetical protein
MTTSPNFQALMTVLTVVVGWLLALKLNYCIPGNKYKGNNNGETDSKKYQSMKSDRAKIYPGHVKGLWFSAWRAEN